MVIQRGCNLTTAITTAYIQGRIDHYLSAVTAYEAAILALSSGTVRSYTLSTGQSSQTVSKRDVSRLQSELDTALARLEYWDRRLNYRGATHVRAF